MEQAAPSFVLEGIVTSQDRIRLEVLLSNLLDEIGPRRLFPISLTSVSLEYPDGEVRPTVRMRLSGCYSAFIPNCSVSSVIEDPKNKKVTFEYRGFNFLVESVS